MFVQTCPSVRLVHNRGCTAGALGAVEEYRLQWNALQRANARLNAGADAADKAICPRVSHSSLHSVTTPNAVLFDDGARIYRRTAVLGLMPRSQVSVYRPQTA
jgi:hypothetical protein